MRKALALAAGLSLSILTAWSYPLDGYEQTGIRRLKAFQMVQDGLLTAKIKLPPGALLPSGAIRLRLADIDPGFSLGAETRPDPELQRGLEEIFGLRDPSYAVALLDITDPRQPRYAALRPDLGYVPGSLGKLLVMTALFDQLKNRVGESELSRGDFLRQTQATADKFALTDHHEVPIVTDDWTGLEHRTIRVGDRFSLWEWLDHMVSPSANAAASMVWKEALLMEAFGRAYPPSADREAAFFRDTGRAELQKRAVEVIERPLVTAGLNPDRLSVRTLFTSGASRVIPGGASYATPQEFLRWLVRLEQGHLIDRWSSLEMKKLMYFTRQRYRYAASPALAGSAVFFKSGSLYRCRPEEGFKCGAYRGNELNLMHSVAIVESPSRGGGPVRVYLVVVMSNVLRVNSAEEHLKIASEIEALIQGIPR